jgi:hypothetical protein
LSNAQRTSSASALAVAGLTVLALGLRFVGFHESLFADEIYTYRIVGNYGFLDVIGQVHDTAITPPLHYLLARVAVELGEPTSWIRLPSILLGAATVPITYLLGLRTVGRGAALFAAAVAAISPFTVFYGTEARAYATMLFLVVLSTLALLIALDTGRRRWLVLYVIAAALVLYAHYSGVFVVAVQAVWSLAAHRERFRELLVANLAIALLYAPWLPSFLFQGDEHPPDQISVVSQVTLDSLVDTLLGTFPGRPFVVLDVVPGPLALVTIAAATLLAAGAALWALRSSGSPLPRPSSRTALLWALALATPIGISLYSLIETSLFGPRNLAASLPAAWLLLGRLLTSPRGRLAVVAPAVVLVALGVGTARSLETENRRPPYREAAAFVDDRARGCDPVVEVLWLSPKNALSKALEPQLKRPHPLFRIREDTGWAPVARSQRVLLVIQPVEALRDKSWNRRLGGGYELSERRQFAGVIPVVVYDYRRTEGDARPTRLVGDRIRLSGGGTLRVDRPETPGFVEVVTSKDEVLKVHGWAIDSRAGVPPRRILVFDRQGCLLMSGRPETVREDVAREHGEGFRRSGFQIEQLAGDAEKLAQPGAVRVFGASRTRAWELTAGDATYPQTR